VNVKTLYVLAAILFYLSIPVAGNVAKLVFLARGYDRELIFKEENKHPSEEMIEKHYAAFEKEGPLIAYITRAIIGFWILTFIFSIVLIRKGISLPLKFEIVTAVASGGLIVVVVGPMLIFGKGWPPRPF
jgi:uncharacterized membrane protein YdbT with pleckstrin-like domain